MSAVVCPEPPGTFTSIFTHSDQRVSGQPNFCKPLHLGNPRHLRELIGTYSAQPSTSPLLAQELVHALGITIPSVYDTTALQEHR